MNNKKYKDDDTISYSEGTQTKYFNAALKYDNEFYKEEDNIEQPSITVRMAKLRKGEDWEILENKKIVLILKGIRFSNKEKDYFKTIEGMQFIINGYKKGWDSVLKFKNELKGVK